MIAQDSWKINLISFWLASLLLFICFFLFLSLCFPTVADAQMLTPAEARELRDELDPGRVGESVSPRPFMSPPTVIPPSELEMVHEGKLSPEAAKLKFRLKKLHVQHPVVFTEQELIQPYRHYLNSTITLGQLQAMADEMTARYQAEGYFLTQVLLPAQHIRNGEAVFRVVTGHIDKVEIAGHFTPQMRELLERYLEYVKCEYPPSMHTLERYALLANDVPGLKVRVILSPSKHKQGATDLIFVAFQKQWAPYISVNNYGTKFLGALQYIAGVDVFSAIRTGDDTNLQYVTSGDSRLNFLQFRHSEILCDDGLRVALAARVTRVKPGDFLEQFDTVGFSQSYGMNFAYPYIRSRSENLFLHAGIYAINSSTNLLQMSIYNDRIREVYAGFTYNNLDPWRGINQFEADIGQGLNIFDASGRTHISRPNGNSVYTKFKGGYSRLQGLFCDFSFYFAIKGQFTNTPLLAAAQFGFGGMEFGRGYDPSEITGDRGFGSTLELRYDWFSDSWVMQNMQYYLFYDAGQVWNVNPHDTLTFSHLSATSTGAGVRMYAINNIVSANFFIAKPLTYTSINVPHKKIRAFFSITAVF